MKSKISEKVCILLLRKGYTIKWLPRGCFDLISRKGPDILLIKILEDANSISKEYAEQMQRIGKYIGASPLIITEKAGGLLKDFVVYSRFGVATLTFTTFKESMDDRLPFVRSDHSGLIAEICGERLKRMREEEGMSLNTIARKVGVSSRMITRYENEDSKITVGKAMKMYDIFGHEIFNKINIFQRQPDTPSDIKSDLTKKYHDLGFEATHARKVPFNIIARKDNEIILTEVGDRMSHDHLSLAKLIDADSLVIFSKKKPKNVASLTKKEFLEYEEANELVKFLKEF